MATCLSVEMRLWLNEKVITNKFSKSYLSSAIFYVWLNSRFSFFHESMSEAQTKYN